jgi:hypothetical protein
VIDSPKYDGELHFWQLHHDPDGMCYSGYLFRGGVSFGKVTTKPVVHHIPPVARIRQMVLSSKVVI